MIYLMCGRRETGKTTLAEFIVSGCDIRLKFDPRGLLPAPNGRVFALTGTPEDTARVSDIVLTPRGRVQPAFESFARYVRALMDRGTEKRIGWLIDEFRLIDDPEASDDFEWILRCTSRDHIVAITCHRPVDIPVSVRAIADQFCFFQTSQENDLDKIADRCGRSVAAKVARLQPRQFVVWDDSRGRDYTVTDPGRWYRALESATPRPSVSASRLDDMADRSRDDRGGKLTLW